MATYVERLQQANPQIFGELSKLMSITANEQYGGVPQDWQAQIFTPIDTSKVPKEIPFTKPNQYLIREQDSDGNVTREEVTTDKASGGQLLRYGEAPKGYELIWERDSQGEQDIRTGYKKTIEDVNGLPITALYDLNGGLKGFEGADDKRNWLSGNQSVSGQWDASGMPTPKQHTSGGSFFSRIAGIGNVVAAMYGGPLGVLAWNMAQGKNLEDSAKAAAKSWAIQQAVGSFSPTTEAPVVDAGGAVEILPGASSISAADIAAANASADPIAYLNATQEWTLSDPSYLAAIGATPEMIAMNTPVPEPIPEVVEPAPDTPAPTTENIVDEIAKGNADRAALNSNEGYGDTMTSAQIDAYDKAIASGLTVSEALNYARAALLVNAVAGDPLNLGGGKPEQAPAGPVGFEMVPIPAEWKSPTYAASSAPIDLDSIFSNKNMLGGTQWQGLPSQQKNMSFDDIFAARQQTPMGSPVDINQIVSAILGQAATSSKPT